MKFCPHCGGDLSKFATAAAALPVVQEKYDQTKSWKKIVEKVRATIGSSDLQTFSDLAEGASHTVLGLVNGSDPLETVVQIAFDQDITPSGGLLHRAIMFDGRLPPQAEQVEAMNYAMSDGKIVLVDDVPVSRAYTVLEYWGGEKQHRRWHMTQPVKIDPSRNGNPFFMDSEMLAFGVTWKDPSKVKESLETLLGFFANGINGERPIAKALVVEVARIS
jgi:hypothetical protein